MTNQVQTMQGQQITPADSKPPSKFDSFRSGLTDKKKSIEKVLPAHISFEKFQSVVLTACMSNSDLLTAHRPSMMLACVQAATDGLLPDNREAALVIFNSKIGKDDSGRDIWGKKVQYMPMYSGILKKVRQSEQLASINTQIVYENDKFEHRLGDDDQIIHSVVDGNNRGAIKAAYCVAKLKDGTIMREVMYINDIEKVRKTSKSGALTEKDLNYSQHKGKEIGAPKGIWADWYEEMAKKTVFRRLAKWLPQSTDKDGNEIRLFDEDESLEVLDQHEESVTWDENGEITPEAETKPDLKAIAQAKKEEAEPKTDKKPAEEIKPEPVKEKSTLDLVEELTKETNEATDYNSFYDLVTLERVDDLIRIEKESPKAFAELDALIKSKSAELKGE